MQQERGRQKTGEIAVSAAKEVVEEMLLQLWNIQKQESREQRRVNSRGEQRRAESESKSGGAPSRDIACSPSPWDTNFRSIHSSFVQECVDCNSPTTINMGRRKNLIQEIISQQEDMEKKDIQQRTENACFTREGKSKETRQSPTLIQQGVRIGVGVRGNRSMKLKEEMKINRF